MILALCMLMLFCIDLLPIIVTCRRSLFSYQCCGIICIEFYPTLFYTLIFLGIFSKILRNRGLGPSVKSRVPSYKKFTYYYVYPFFMRRHPLEIFWQSCFFTYRYSEFGAQTQQGNSL